MPTSRQKPAKSGAERRSRLYAWTGGALAVWIAVLFVAVAARTIHRNRNWQTDFFSDAQVFGDDCAAAVAGGTTPTAAPDVLAGVPLVPVEHVPHVRGLFEGRVQGEHPTYHVHYQCRVDLLSHVATPGAAYLHLGFVFGDWARIDVNGTARQTLTGQDQVVIPLTAADLGAGQLVVDVYASLANLHRLGMTSNHPVAFATGFAANTTIFSLRAVLDAGMVALSLLPTLTLGLVLAFGWWLGIRTRLVHAAFYYFAITSTSFAGPWLRDWLPVPTIKLVLVMAPLFWASGFALLYLAMETLQIFARRLYPLMTGTLAAAGAGTAYMIFYPGVFPYSVLVSTAVNSIAATAMVTVLAVGVARLWRRSKVAGEADVVGALVKARSELVMLCLLAVAAGARLLDVWWLWEGVGASAAQNVDALMPLFVAGSVLATLKATEEGYLIEKRRAAELAEKLALGRAVQELMLPPKGVTQAGGVRVEHVHRSAGEMSGDWVAHWRDGAGRHHVCLGDVVGKGPQAALAVAAIMAVIDDCRRSGLGMDAAVGRVNDTLASLFGRYMTTTFTGCTIEPDGSVSLRNFGGPGWCQVRSGDASHLTIRGAPLGAATLASQGEGAGKLQSGDKLLRIAPGEVLVTFTDGVCDGSRALKRVLKVLPAEVAAGADGERLFVAATTAAWEAGSASGDPAPLDDRSMVVIRAA